MADSAFFSNGSNNNRVIQGPTDNSIWHVTLNETGFEPETAFGGIIYSQISSPLSRAILYSIFDMFCQWYG